MHIRCQHGFFKFTETKIGQISEFMSWSGLTLVPKNDFYTFEFLEETPNFSIAGLDLLGIPAVATFAGEPWEVFEANGFVYDFNADLLKPIETVLTKTKIVQAGDKFISQGLIMPGSLTDSGDRVKDYAAWFSMPKGTFKYSEVTYVE
jgi:hypothetical protein